MKSRRALAALVTLCLLPCAAALAGPRIEHWQTSNGARVYFVAAPEIPMLDVRVVFAAGSARDDGRAGVANLTNGLLNEGAGELDADAFNNEISATGAIMGHGAERDMAFASLRSLAEGEHASRALELFVLALAKPRFDSSALERDKARTLVALQHREQSPDAVADDVFYASLYPKHPYGSSPDGTPASVSAITRDDVRAFHGKYYVARNAVIAIVGAVDQARAAAIAEQLSQALPAGERAPALPVVAPPAAALKHVEFPSIQSHVMVGLPGVSRGDPDYFPLLVGNHALGGNSLVSILFDEVRDKRGLSYSVSSYFVAMAQAGPFVAELQTDRKQQDEALKVLTDTIARFVEQGPPAGSIEAARRNLIDGFPLRIASNRQTVEYIAMIGFYDLPLDYLDTFASKVAAVTPEAVKDAFSRRVSPDRLTTVVVGRGADKDQGS
ncbi:MAG: insulinase family protein [Proteobacteria bacterium]|nr:insulinase family protein [Pseudomonadota bacterium]